MEPATPVAQQESTLNVPSSNQENPTALSNTQGHASNLTRFAAYLIDSFILGIVTAIFYFILTANSAQVVGFITALVYFGYFLSTTGQTVGMKFLGIKISKEDGTLLNFGLAAVRHFLFGIITTFTLGVGALWALWDGKKQTLYDKIFHTCYYSVNENKTAAKWVIGLNCCGCFLIPVIILVLISLGVATGSMLNNVPGAAGILPNNSMKNTQKPMMDEKPTFEKKVETPMPTSYQAPSTTDKLYPYVKLETATESFKAGVIACSDAAKKNPALSKYDVTEYCKCAMDQTINQKMDLEFSVKYCANYLPEEVQNLIK